MSTNARAFLIVLVVLLLTALLVVYDKAHAAEPSTVNVPAPQWHEGDRPLSAIAVSQCEGALAIFIQLDADHLLRADPRQSDMFVNVNGKMVQAHAPPMEWSKAYALASMAVLTTHVVVPCPAGEQGT